MDEITSLLIPFISIVIFASMIDMIAQAIEFIIEKLPRFPDRLEQPIAYVVVVIISFLICWQGNFDLFRYLDIHFNYVWQGWLMTAFVISGGSTFVRYKFGLIEKIPSGISNVRVNFSNMFKSDVDKKKDNNDENPPKPTI